VGRCTSLTTSLSLELRQTFPLGKTLATSNTSVVVKDKDALHGTQNAKRHLESAFQDEEHIYTSVAVLQPCSYQPLPTPIALSTPLLAHSSLLDLNTRI